MQESETIQVLGRGTNVDFTIDDRVPFEIAERGLREYLEICRGLYSSGTVSVNVGRRILVPDQLTAIKDILDRETGLTVTRYWCAPDILHQALAESATLQQLPEPPVAQPENAVIDGERDLAVPVAGKGRDGEAPADTQAEPLNGSQNGSQADVGVEVWQLALGLFNADQEPTEGPEPRVSNTGPPNAATNSGETARDGGGNLPATAGVAGAEINGLAHSSENEMAPRPTTAEIPYEPPSSSLDQPEEMDSGTTLDSQPNDEEPLTALRRGNEALIIKNTCRSGELIQYPGDVVVYGDVNPGAEIVAGGDIVVLGTLRGMARAGVEGNADATIFALNLESQRLQIGSHVGEAPDSVRRAKSDGRSTSPKIAYLRRRSVFVAPYTRRREEYQGGILYEG